MKKGTLYLIPSPLGETSLDTIIPQGVLAQVRKIDAFVAENAKTVRQYLKQVGMEKPLQQIDITVLDEHTQKKDVEELLAPLLQGRDLGLISEAGCPAVADPGSELVLLAHKKNIKVVPLVGPSSILLALMGSGLNGQRFCFHGYLPVDEIERAKKIRELEKESRSLKQTQIFIETPYRNLRLYDSLLKNCFDSTVICIAADLTLDSEYIATMRIKQWKSLRPEIDKRPALFLLLA